MARDARGAIVSVRISEDEQNRLREKAESSGSTISELLRRAALSEVNDDRDVEAGQTITMSAGKPDVGVFWRAPDGAQVEGSTLTL